MRGESAGLEHLPPVAASTTRFGELVIYSPAPVTTGLHRLNTDLAAALCSGGGSLSAKLVAKPLPDSINSINALAGDVKARHLPIVTTIDFLPAINRQGPEWHTYGRANADLKMAAALYDVGFGLLATTRGISSPEDLRGMKIGVPARPSSVRVFTEALLRDGWGILDTVELVDLPPSDVPDAVSSGEIDATTWNLMPVTSEGVLPAIPALLQRLDARWIEVDDRTISRINKSNPFKVSGLSIETDRIAGAICYPAATAKLLSFRQGLAVWDSTPDTVVEEILACLKNAAARFPGLPGSVSEMARWPCLTKELTHRASVEFFGCHGVSMR